VNPPGQIAVPTDTAVLAGSVRLVDTSSIADRLGWRALIASAGER
jgi:hypothetical protein